MVLSLLEPWVELELGLGSELRSGLSAGATRWPGRMCSGGYGYVIHDPVMGSMCSGGYGYVIHDPVMAEVDPCQGAA